MLFVLSDRHPDQPGVLQVDVVSGAQPQRLRPSPHRPRHGQVFPAAGSHSAPQEGALC